MMQPYTLQLLEWPELELTDSMTDMLALQLYCWAMVSVGMTPPDDFTEWLDEVSKVTGCWTATECQDKAARIILSKNRKAIDIGR